LPITEARRKHRSPNNRFEKYVKNSEQGFLHRGQCPFSQIGMESLEKKVRDLLRRFARRGPENCSPSQT
jgi:hypothetical protein